MGMLFWGFKTASGCSNMGNIGINKLPGEMAKEYGYQPVGSAQVGDLGSWDNQATGKMDSIQVRGQQASKIAFMVNHHSHREEFKSYYFIMRQDII
jgi:hypothetical protein